MNIVHIINPVKVNESSDLFIAQPITFETLRIAKGNSREVEVVQCTAQYKEDIEIIPDHMEMTRNLRRSVADFGGQALKRKLPILKDILKRAFRNTKAGDYIIYTNVDIAVKPEFYNWINDRIHEGLDAFIINRRTIDDRFSTIEEIPEMYKEIGEKHPGYDCFVFKRDILRKAVLGNVCIGAAYIGLVMYINLKLFSNSFKEFGDEHLTFHIGNDKIWKNPENNPYEVFNKKEYQKVVRKLKRRFDNLEDVINSAFPTAREIHE